MNFADILVLVAITILVIFAISMIIKNKRNGKNSCGCDCSHCSNSCKNNDKN